MASFIDRIDEVRRNKESLGGYEMKIVKYNNYHDIWVEFQDEHRAKVHTEYGNFKKGDVKNPYHKSVFGIGYVGIGKHKTSENGESSTIYRIWQRMLQRCYDKRYQERQQTYINCYVCEEWHNFQNFAEWCEENYYEIDGDRIELDKDILCKNNKIYSPETCVFVPKRINSLFTNRKRNRGECVIGVEKLTSGNYRPRCNVFDEEKRKYKSIHLGVYKTEEKAFYKYKKFKENYIKQVADEYYQADLIPERLYWAMYWWEVNIDD